MPMCEVLRQFNMAAS